MNDLDLKNDYFRKLTEFVVPEIKDILNLDILEFGVRKGISTSIFLDICRKNNGKLYSNDVDDYKLLYSDEIWNFIHCRDDNYSKIEKIIPKKLDLIYLDSYHEPNHVEKIFRYYYPKIKTGGFYIIDDICWLPYVRGNYRDNFGCEIANLETYKRLIEVYYKNTENFDLEFSFVGSGLAKIKKKTDNDLNVSVKVPSRNYSLMNLVKKIIK
ncbi:class I SAM-dependent methyltransferase [Candidatus Pelagibacter sp.]|nr:class I SAM-dependent methyltransferase [Candidatus Pelagibacter sp.]